MGRCLEAKRITRGLLFRSLAHNQKYSFWHVAICHIIKGGFFMHKKRKVFTTKTLTYSAMLVALSVAINSLRIGNISFGGFPIIFSGLTMGPIVGFVVGGVADVIGFIIRPSASGGFNPLFILTSALTGLIPGLVIILLKDKYPNYKPWKVFIAIATGQLITTVLMVPLFITYLRQSNLLGTSAFWTSYYARVTLAFSRQALNVPIYTVLFSSIIKPLSKTFNPDK